MFSEIRLTRGKFLDEAEDKEAGRKEAKETDAQTLP